MPTFTFYPLGNADTTRLVTRDGHHFLFDYADVAGGQPSAAGYADLPRLLRADLVTAGRDAFDVVAFTHLDRDHVCGAPAFFHLLHAPKYQGGGRVHIRELWVPAFAITETRNELCDDARIIQEEARYRLLYAPHTVRVFSRPEALRAWLMARNVSLESRLGRITDAGTDVPGWTLAADGVEFFVHAPSATRLSDGTFDDRNDNSLVLQAVFQEGGQTSRVLLLADATHELLTHIVDTTRGHGRSDRLRWDLVKIPHHCSYKSLSSDSATDPTAPAPSVAALYETYGATLATLVSTSDRIPTAGPSANDGSVQPPHPAAFRYYRRVGTRWQGSVHVTMEHSSASAPAPLTVRITGWGVQVEKPVAAGYGGGALGAVAPRAGAPAGDAAPVSNDTADRPR